MIVLLGSTGYIGRAFVSSLQARRIPFSAPGRADLDYSSCDSVVKYLRSAGATFVINSAGYTGRPNVDACETHQSETLHGNCLMPLTVANACASINVPWGHLSSGCIYKGCKIAVGGGEQVEADLLSPKVRELLEQRDISIRGFNENDAPNFSFSHPPCSFYSGTKALAEEALGKAGSGYLWRVRIPFDGIANSKNYLTKIQAYPRVYDNFNSFSHRTDAVNACLDLWEKRAPFGIYNVCNPGYISAREVVAMIEEILKPARRFSFWSSDDEFYSKGAVAPRSNCILDVSKLLGVGVRLRTVQEAMRDSLANWKT